MTGSRIAQLIVLALIILLVVYVARNTYWTEVTVPMPPKGEAARNPFYAAQKFAEELGATTRWDRVLVAPATNAVIVISAWHWDLTAGRRQRLERWVESGGRLVVDSSMVGGEEVFERWSGIASFYPVQDEDEDEEDEEEGDGEEGEESERDVAERTVRARLAALERQCDQLETPERTQAHALGSKFSVCGLDRLSALRSSKRAVWALRDKLGTQVVRVNIGRGSVTVINAAPFRYRGLFDGDHAKLFVAATQLSRGDAVHFLSEEEHPTLLTLMWEYGSPVVLLFLALVALALWRTGPRFGPLVAPTDPARRSLAEQIRGTGQFALRFGGGESLHAATVRALNEAAQKRVSSYTRLSSEERVETLARLTGYERDALASAINFSGPRRSNELRSAIALLEAARRRILTEHKRS